MRGTSRGQANGGIAVIAGQAPSARVPLAGIIPE